MATVYIKPGTGTGTGTASDPYFFSQLATAETGAGSGGTIFFTDGNYGSANTVFDSVGVSYKALNPNKGINGAYFQKLGQTDDTGAPGKLTIGSTTADGITVSGFYFENFRLIANATAGNTTPHTINNCHIKSTQHLFYAAQGILSSVGSSDADSYVKVTNCSFYVLYSRVYANDKVVSLDPRWQIFNCSWYGSRGSNSFDVNGWNEGGNDTFKNSIFVGDSATTWNNSASNTFNGKSTNCCFYDLDETTEGGTNNLFADPQFVDLTNADLRLRPSSPCINAGTAS